MKKIKKVKSLKNKKQKKEKKWYMWLKNNIIENEKEISKKEKNRRLIVSLFAIFCFFVVFFSTAVIDYSYAIKRNSAPFLVITYKEKYSQKTIYYGVFYKAWKCDNGDTRVNFSPYKNKIPYCEIKINYDKNGIYTNPNKVKMTASQISIINKFYKDDINFFKTSQDLEKAYTISKAINQVWWVRTKSEVVLNDDPNIEIAIFGKYYFKDGVEAWETQHNDPKYYKCIKKSGADYVFAEYNEIDKTCEEKWNKLKLDKEICEIAMQSTDLIRKLVIISQLCK